MGGGESERINPSQHPLQMPIRQPRLELRLHVPGQERLRPHEPALVVLHAHRPLRPIEPGLPVRGEQGRVLQVRLRDDDGRRGRLLEAERAVPGHVLDGEEGPVGDDDHVQVRVGDQDPVRGFDDLGQHVLDRVHGEVPGPFGPAGVVAAYFGAADNHGIEGADGPGDVGGRVDGGFDVGSVEVGGCAFRGIEECGREGEHVPEEGALLVDFVDVETGVEGQCGSVDQVENVTVGLAGVVEVYRGLVSGRWEGEILFSEVGVSAGFIETLDFGDEGVVESEHSLVLEGEGYGCNLLLCVVELADYGVVDQSSCRYM